MHLHRRAGSGSTAVSAPTGSVMLTTSGRAPDFIVRPVRDEEAGEQSSHAARSSASVWRACWSATSTPRGGHAEVQRRMRRRPLGEDAIHTDVGPEPVEERAAIRWAGDSDCGESSPHPSASRRARPGPG